MKRAIVAGLAAASVAAVGYGLYALGHGPEWTTDSPAALAEFEAAVEAEGKIYYDEAQEHLEKALAIDPDFVIAKLELAGRLSRTDAERAKRLTDEALAADLDRLTPRERVRVERTRALREKRVADAQALVDAYLERHPDDPHILAIKASSAMASEHGSEAAERLYRRLLEVQPNFVVAYNQLGYLTMARGHFAEAEEYFISYRFIAPDQANPHDSLGELYMLRGRYDEAEATLREAIRIKPDFWASYEHLVMLAQLRRDPDAVRAAVAQAVSAGCPEDLSRALTCVAEYFERVVARDWRWILDQADVGCLEEYRRQWPAVVTHFAACKLGDFDGARDVEEGFRSRYVESPDVSETGQAPPPPFDKELEAKLPAGYWHMVAVRLALEGQLVQALQVLEKVDVMIAYANVGDGILKLNNRLVTAEVLFALDRPADGHRLLSQVAAVNPALAQRFQDDGLKLIGLR